MRIVFLVPRREDNGQRDALWAWCKRRWEALMPDVPIFEGHHTDGPFNRSAAINRAAELAGEWDVAVVLDSDVFVPIPNVRAAIAEAANGRVTWAHRRWRGISEADSKRLIRYPDTFGEVPAESRDMDLLVEKTTPLSWSCCVAIPRASFDDMGGFDERFIGWGFEDGAWSALVRALYSWTRIEGDIYHLWHARSDERVILGQPGSTASDAYVRNALLGRRYMIAALRDHPADDEPLAAKDVANLTHDDRRFLAYAHARGLPDWSDWWPTLEELRDGAKEYRIEGDHARMTVTVIVHTGGEAETWGERSGYLRRSLQSLSEQVTGPITQRVLYSDWGAERLDELTAIGAPFGFYVAGPSEHLGYTRSMQSLWRYVAKRALGAYVFQVEDDFEYLRSVDLGPMMDTLAAESSVAQLVLLREPCYPREFERGGILGWPLADFEQGGSNGTSWLAHRLFWSQNPSIFRRSITATPWPSGSSSERLFGDALLRDERLRFALWGSGEAWIRHLGEVRASSAY